MSVTRPEYVLYPSGWQLCDVLRQAPLSSDIARKWVERAEEDLIGRCYAPKTVQRTKHLRSLSPVGSQNREERKRSRVSQSDRSVAVRNAAPTQESDSESASDDSDSCWAQTQAEPATVPSNDVSSDSTESDETDSDESIVRNTDTEPPVMSSQKDRQLSMLPSQVPATTPSAFSMEVDISNGSGVSKEMATLKQAEINEINDVPTAELLESNSDSDTERIEEGESDTSDDSSDESASPVNVAALAVAQQAISGEATSQLLTESDTSSSETDDLTQDPVLGHAGTKSALSTAVKSVQVTSSQQAPFQTMQGRTKVCSDSDSDSQDAAPECRATAKPAEHDPIEDSDDEISSEDEVVTTRSKALVSTKSVPVVEVGKVSYEAAIDQPAFEIEGEHLKGCQLRSSSIESFESVIAPSLLTETSSMAVEPRNSSECVEFSTVQGSMTYVNAANQEVESAVQAKDTTKRVVASKSDQKPGAVEFTEAQEAQAPNEKSNILPSVKAPAEKSNVSLPDVTASQEKPNAHALPENRASVSAKTANASVSETPGTTALQKVRSSVSWTRRAGGITAD